MKSLGLLFFVLPLLLNGQSIHPALEFEITYTGFSSPIDMAHAGDGSGRLFVAEKSGIVKVIDNTGTILTTPFMNISNKVTNSGERGLLGIAFHPDYSNNGYLFLHYSNLNSDTQISRFTVDQSNLNLIDTSSEESIITVVQPRSNHNGGSIEFGPDGYLYIALGDGGGGGDPDNDAQNTRSLLGKMLRLDIDNGLPYTVPASNPFTTVDTIRDEIWALGLRNPFRFSFDSQTGDMWIGDVGQNAWEEVNFQPANSLGGENYGWRCYEGNHTFNTNGCEDMSQYVGPVFEYAQVGSGWSVTGGMVYRGENPCLDGIYICADFVKNIIFTVKSDGQGGWTDDNQTPGIGNIAAFAEDENNELYAVSIGGTIYKVNAADVILTEDPLSSGNYISAGSLSLEASINHDSIVMITAQEGILLEPELNVEEGGLLEGNVGCPE